MSKGLFFFQTSSHLEGIKPQLVHLTFILRLLSISLFVICINLSKVSFLIMLFVSYFKSFAKKSKNFATDSDEPCPPSDGIIAFLNLLELKNASHEEDY